MADLQRVFQDSFARTGYPCRGTEHGGAGIVAVWRVQVGRLDDIWYLGPLGSKVQPTGGSGYRDIKIYRGMCPCSLADWVRE